MVKKFELEKKILLNINTRTYRKIKIVIANRIEELFKTTHT